MKRILVVCTALVALLLADVPAFARHRMAFVPGRHGYTVAAHSYRHVRSRGSWRGHRGARGRSGRRAPASSGRDGEAGATVPPPPGSGFKMEDGVLTYPAPARFQPKNLPRLR